MARVEYVTDLSPFVFLRQMTAFCFATRLGFLLIFTSMIPADAQEPPEVQSLPDSIARAKAEFASHRKLAKERYLLESQDALKRLKMSWESEIERAKRNGNQKLADALASEWKSFQATLGDPVVDEKNLAGPSKSADTVDSSKPDHGGVANSSSDVDSSVVMFADFLAPLQKAFNDAELGETQDRRDVLRERASKRIDSRFGGKSFSIRLPISSVTNTEGDSYRIELEPIPIAGVDYFYGGPGRPEMRKGFHLNSRTLTMKRSEAEVVLQGGWLEVSGRIDPVIHDGADIKPYRNERRNNCFPIFTVALNPSEPFGDNQQNPGLGNLGLVQNTRSKDTPLIKLANSDFILTISLYDEKVKHIPLDARTENGN